MSILTFILLVFSMAIGTGFIGSLTGLGGGIFLTPFLVLFLGVDPHYALATSLVAVICTSSGASIPFLKEKLVNYRIGLFLETAAIVGAPLGAAIAMDLPKKMILLLFALLLFYSSYANIKGSKKGQRRHFDFVSDPLAIKLNLPGHYITSWGEAIIYPVRHLKSAWLLMFIAGMLSGVLGIGSGSLKVLAMDRRMGLPYKISTATSNFMIGLTAIASLGIYWQRGYVIPELAIPVIPGILMGAHLGAQTVSHTPVHKIRWIFTAVLFTFAIQLFLKGVW